MKKIKKKNVLLSKVVPESKLLDCVMLTAHESAIKKRYII